MAFPQKIFHHNFPPKIYPQQGQTNLVFLLSFYRRHFYLFLDFFDSSKNYLAGELVQGMAGRLRYSLSVESTEQTERHVEAAAGVSQDLSGHLDYSPKIPGATYNAQNEISMSEYQRGVLSLCLPLDILYKKDAPCPLTPISLLLCLSPLLFNPHPLFLEI